MSTAVMAMALLALTASAASAATIVSPGSLDDWTTTTSPPTTGTAASAVFELGPATPPTGLGSLQLSPGSDGNSAAQARNADYGNVKVADLTGLSYWAYVDVETSGSPPPDQAPYIILQVNLQGDAVADTDDDLLFFEPLYQGASFVTGAGTAPQGPIALDTWQFWNAREGAWWSVNSSAGAGQGASVKSLDQILAAFPNMTIRNSSATSGGLRFVTGFGGTPWDNFVGNIDTVQVATKTSNETFDFEPDSDGDTFADVEDNCPAVANADQANTDGDAQGDACDTDDDNDGDADGADNCPTTANPNQENNEGDAQGDICDPDDDNDGVSDAAEAAIGTSPTDSDADDDGVNDSADACPKTPGTLANGCPATPPDDAPPSVQITAPAANATVNPTTGVTLAATATDDKGVTQVAFVDADGVICTDSTAPYGCEYKPTGDDVGKNTIIAIATDAAGQTGTASRRVSVARFASGPVSLKVSPKRDASAPYRFRMSGRVSLPTGVTAAQGCRGTVILRIRRGARSAAATNAPLKADCTYSRVVAVGAANVGALRGSARFAGNAVTRPRSSNTVSLRAG